MGPRCDEPILEDGLTKCEGPPTDLLKARRTPSAVVVTLLRPWITTQTDTELKPAV